jgi:hypothetical protein
MTVVLRRAKIDLAARLNDIGNDWLSRIPGLRCPNGRNGNSSRGGKTVPFRVFAIPWIETCFGIALRRNKPDARASAGKGEPSASNSFGAQPVVTVKLARVPDIAAAAL